MGLGSSAVSSLNYDETTFSYTLVELVEKRLMVGRVPTNIKSKVW